MWPTVRTPPKVLGLEGSGDAARGGLLHDLYLYDSKDKSAHPGWQCFDHPRAAARNAGELTWLSDKERNIILSHMWPLGGKLCPGLERLGWWTWWTPFAPDWKCPAFTIPPRLRERLGSAPPSCPPVPDFYLSSTCWRRVFLRSWGILR